MSASGQIVFDFQQIDNDITVLTRLRNEFQEKMIDIDEEEKQLIQKWQGDASTAFDERWRRQYVNLQNLYELLGDYINALSNIAENDDNVEKRNISIANNN